jgi:hypothetical protein
VWDDGSYRDEDEDGYEDEGYEDYDNEEGEEEEEGGGESYSQKEEEEEKRPSLVEMYDWEQPLLTAYMTTVERVDKDGILHLEDSPYPVQLAFVSRPPEGEWEERGRAMLKDSLERQRVVVVELAVPEAYGGPEPARNTREPNAVLQVLLYPPVEETEEMEEEDLSEAKVLDFVQDESFSEVLINSGLARVSKRRERAVYEKLQPLSDWMHSTEHSEEEGEVAISGRVRPLLESISKVVTLLYEAETKTYKARTGMFEYGDAGYDTDGQPEEENGGAYYDGY